MSSVNSWVDYQQQIDQVTAYIYAHLEDELDLFTLAEVACLSPHHWHRIYHALRGETAAATVKRLRLQRAAGYLAQTSLSVKEIAKRCGYQNLQSFTRTFAVAYGLPPATYRAEGSHAVFQTERPIEPTIPCEIEIKTINKIKAVSLQHTGAYLQIGEAFDPLYSWLASHNHLDPEMRLIGAFYDDPTAVPESELRSRACIVLREEVVIEEPIQFTELSAGTYAVFRHKGPYATMKAAYAWLFGKWLVQSGRELVDQPILEEYLNNPQDTAPNELLTDIYLGVIP